LAKNRLIEDIPLEEQEGTVEQEEKSRKRSFKLKLPRPAFVENERFRNISGLLLLLLAAFLAVSFTSFLFTWKNDQDVLYSSWIELFANSEVVVDNWLGKFGAIASNALIHDGFGVPAFFFVVALLLIGLRAGFGIRLLPLWSSLKFMLFSMVWLSVSLAYLFSFRLLFLGGKFGHSINQWLEASFGGIGTGLVLVFSLFTFIILRFNIPFERVRNWVNGMMSVDTRVLDEHENQNEKEVEPVVAEAAPSPDPEPEVVAEEPAQETAEEPEEELSIEPAVEEPVAEDPSSSSGPQEEDPATELSTEVPEVEAKEESDEDLTLDIEDKPETEEELDQKKIDKIISEQGEYDPTLDLSDFKLPPVDLLEARGEGKVQVNREELEENKNKIVTTLRNYNIEISKIKATIGPTVTLYEIVPAPGVRISKIKNLEDDIALSLSALGIRIIAPIPGKGTIGIEVPNLNPDIVSMRAVIASDKFQKTDMALPVALGKTIQNETFIADLAKMPHLLMAGATGQGKSVGLNAILVSLLYKRHPSQVKFVLVDPKKVELTLFNKIERHYLAKLPNEEEAIITDTKKVVNTLNSLCVEMDQRYELLKNAHARNIKEYNAKFKGRKLNPKEGHKYLPYIVLVVDEFADLIMTAGKEVETPIARLAQLARAIGIHLIIATQRPSVNIITGVIKANFPSRIAFRVTAKIDSRTILDASGADQLIGRGDMLLSMGSEVIRLQCAFVDTPEVEQIVDFIGGQRAFPEAHLLPEYVDESSDGPGSLDDMDRDAMFEDAARIVVMHQQGSASLLQRKLKLGYNRAGRIVDQLEAAGIIGPFEGSKARQVLIPDELSLEHLLNGLEEEGPKE
jgi:S-DNA-T family DNA segregation ATPase FtsK/SpoIIIE